MATKKVAKKSPTPKKSVAKASTKQKSTSSKAKAVAPKKPKSVPKKVTKKADEEVKLRIRVRAYESKLLDSSVKQITDTAFRYEAELRGPVPLPNEIKKYTVNRSTFVHKDAREQFEMRIHKRLIDIINPSQKVIDALSNMALPSGVEIDIKMI